MDSRSFGLVLPRLHLFLIQKSETIEPLDRLRRLWLAGKKRRSMSVRFFFSFSFVSGRVRLSVKNKKKQQKRRKQKKATPPAPPAASPQASKASSLRASNVEGPEKKQKKTREKRSAKKNVRQNRKKRCPHPLHQNGWKQEGGGGGGASKGKTRASLMASLRFLMRWTFLRSASFFFF